MRILLKGKHIPCKTLIWKSNGTWEKRQEEVSLWTINSYIHRVTDTIFKKKKFTTLRFCGVFPEALFKNLCPNEKLKNCWINYSYTWYRKRATHTDLFFCQFLMMMILSRFTLRRTRPVKPQNRKPNISAAFLHLKIKKHF